MSTVPRDVTSILLDLHIISSPQLVEARKVQEETGWDLEDALIRLGHATPEQVGRARAEVLGVTFLDLTDIQVPPAIIELIPASVARENLVLPIALNEGVLTVAMANPDEETIQKLQFILNRVLHPVLALREQILPAIDRYYGMSETESVDSMLMEFTDTAIDFMETEATCASAEWELSLDLAAPRQAASRPLVDRHATVRYYHRMTPERLFPLLVILSRKVIQEVIKKGVSQAQSRIFQVEEGSTVEVEPILPGCSCYPRKAEVSIGNQEAATTFWVAPRTLGPVMEARVVVRQDGKTLAEVPLEIRVRRQTLTLLMGGLSLLLPFVLLLLKHFRLDFESQLQDGFGLYARLVQWVVASFSPEMLTGVLLAATATAYLALRPRKRDVFWDIQPVQDPESDSPSSPAEPGTSQSNPRQDRPGQRNGQRSSAPGFVGETLADLLRSADRNYASQHYATALEQYEQALNLSRPKAIHYFRASLAAFQMGNTTRALAILQQAEAMVPASEMHASLWYNMGCFACKLGRHREALRYLNRAADGGFTDPEKYQKDPDLEALHWHPGFKNFLAGLVD
jgi:hypothetical protein